jgi:GNAT superfamily N-acetyltransferase
MVRLRPHLNRDVFVATVKRQEAQGYRLAAALDESDEIAAVAGFRFVEMLAWDRALYVDDLVTDEKRRSQGFGQALLDWLVDLARHGGCAQLHLDSGVQRFEAHRFYFRNRMRISSHHFMLPLADM